MAKTYKAKESDMYPYVRQLLRNHYKKKDGWIIKERELRVTYAPDFLIEKTGRKYITRIVVEVKFATSATQAHINQLNGYVSNLAGPNVKMNRKILVYPSGVNTSNKKSELADIEVVVLQSFKCEKRGIAWYK